MQDRIQELTVMINNFTDYYSCSGDVKLYRTPNILQMKKFREWIEERNTLTQTDTEPVMNWPDVRKEIDEFGSFF
jgi:hypothetical protein